MFHHTPTIQTTFVSACLLAATSVVGFATSAAAQNIPVPTATLPSTGGCNVAPFGLGILTTTSWSNQKYQILVSGTQLGSPTTLRICDLAFASCATGIKHFDTIEVVLAQTTASALSTNFITNLQSNAATVLTCLDHDWYRNANVWDRIGFQHCYDYDSGYGPNLVVQITVTGARALTTPYASSDHKGTGMFALSWHAATGSAPPTGTFIPGLKLMVSAERADLHRFGHGCIGSNGLVPELSFPSGSSAQIPGTLAFKCTNALPNAVIAHVIGFSTYCPGVDLGFFGAPGCRLYPVVAMTLAGGANALGELSMAIPIPNDPALLCARLYSQMFPRDVLANSMGVSSTNYGRVLFGY